MYRKERDTLALGMELCTVCERDCVFVRVDPKDYGIGRGHHRVTVGLSERSHGITVAQGGTTG